MPAGAIDLGTNTVRLLVGEVRSGRVEPREYFRRITRLGGGFSPKEGLAPQAMERTLAALREGSLFLRREGAVRVRGVGTEILRSAANGWDFVRRIALETGLSLEIIDGSTEARLTARGVLSALATRPQSCLIFDIGGGSTEFIFWRGQPLYYRSFPLGVVRLAENDPHPVSQQGRIDATLSALRDDLQERDLWSAATAPECRLVGTAGTVTTLAALHLQLSIYDWRRINNLTIELAALQRMLAFLEPMPAAERELLAGMEKGRGDLIVPGLRVVLSLMDLLHHRELAVSDFGLLEGVLLSLDNPAENG